MKLRNKQTGTIRPAEAREDGIYLYDEKTEQWHKYKLDLLAEWWEYYEEPEGWCITMYGGISKISKDDEDFIPDLEEIGNHFNDKESAYDALEKLKALKRLEDKGFKFDDWRVGCVANHSAEVIIYANLDNAHDARIEARQDLDLLFGGEE